MIDKDKLLIMFVVALATILGQTANNAFNGPATNTELHKMEDRLMQRCGEQSERITRMENRLNEHMTEDH